MIHNKLFNDLKQFIRKRKKHTLMKGIILQIYRKMYFSWFINIIAVPLLVFIQDMLNDGLVVNRFSWIKFLVLLK